MHHHLRTYWYIFIPLLVGLISSQIWGYSFDKATSLAILMTSILLWVSEAIPAPITALLIPCLGITYGVISPKEAFSPFASDITFLFIGSFFLALGLEKHRLDKRIAYSIIALGRRFCSIHVLIYLLGAASFFLSMWMSNTATVAILCPITLGVIDIMNKYLASDTERNNFSMAALLFVCYAATFGGIATPIGTPANLLTIGFLRENGVKFSFMEWINWGLPISVISLLFLSLFILKRFRITTPPKDSFNEIYKAMDREKRELGPLSDAEVQIATLFVVSIVLWVSPDLLIAHSSTQAIGLWMSQHLPTANVALMAGITLFLLPTYTPHPRNLVQEEINQIDWGTIFLFGGGLSLSNILIKTGMANELGKIMASVTMHSPLVALTVISISALILSEIISNTASAAILLSIALSTITNFGTVQSASQYGTQSQLVPTILAVGISSSLGFMMPIASPPNTIVYGTGKIPLREMLKTGLIVNFIGLLTIVGFIYLKSS